jgi:hypothetical protein
MEWHIWTSESKADHPRAALLEVREFDGKAVTVGLTREEARALAGELLAAVDPAPDYPPVDER